MHSWLIPRVQLIFTCQYYLTSTWRWTLSGTGICFDVWRIFSLHRSPCIGRTPPARVSFVGISQSKLWYVTCKKRLPYRYSCKRTSFTHHIYHFFWRATRNLRVLPFGDICRPRRSKSEPDVQKLQLKVGNLFGRSRSACRSIMTSFIAHSSWATFVIPSIRMSENLFGYTFYLWKTGLCFNMFQQKKMKGCLEKSMHIINIDVRNLKHHVLLGIETSIWLM